MAPAHQRRRRIGVGTIIGRLIAPALMLAAATAWAQSDGVLGRLVLPRPDAPSVATPASAAARYGLHCAGCHGRDGAGAPQADVPDLRRLGAFLALPGGRDYILKVPGVMASGLDDHQVAAVMNWILATLAPGSAPEGAASFGPAEVARARQAPLIDVASERRRLLQDAARGGVRLY